MRYIQYYGGYDSHFRVATGGAMWLRPSSLARPEPFIFQGPGTARMPETCIFTAQEYLTRGWSIFPLKDKRTPHIQWKPYQERLPTQEEVLQWWTDWPDAWIGCALGAVSNIVRVDVDGQEALNKLQEFGGLPETAEFTTPSGGHGWLLNYKEWLTTDTLWKGEGQHQEIRVQSTGAYTVLPTSPGYTWIRDNPILDPPLWMMSRKAAQFLEEMSPTVRDLDQKEVVAALLHVNCFDDYDDWLHVGMALHDMGDENLAHWIGWSKQSDKFQEGECEGKWASFKRVPGRKYTGRYILWLAYKGGWKPQGGVHEDITDLGFSRILAREGVSKVMHSEKRGWFMWDGRRWTSKDGQKAITEIQKQVLLDRMARAKYSLLKNCNAMLKAALDKDTPQDNVQDLNDKDKRKRKTVSRLRDHQSEPHVRGAVKLAESNPALSFDCELLDTKPWLFNCYNGTLDLQTLELRPHNPEDLLTQLSPTEYIPEATCPRWDKFLREVFAGDEELIAWMQKLLGYCITGVVREHVLPVWYGNGGNGKGTVIRAMEAVLGLDYFWSTPSGFVIQHRNEPHPERLARLHGKRLVIDQETGSGIKLNEEFIKKLTGGDIVTARDMYEKSWQFVPTHKLVIATNNRPSIGSQGPDMWRRIREAPFTQSFMGKEEIGLDSTLKAESPGIFQWLVEGCRRWQVEGLGSVKAVEAASASYKKEQDTIGTFLEANYVLGDGKVKKADVVAKYHAWCILNNFKALDGLAFGKALTAHGVEKDTNYYLMKDVSN